MDWYDIGQSGKREAQMNDESTCYSRIRETLSSPPKYRPLAIVYEEWELFRELRYSGTLAHVVAVVQLDSSQGSRTITIVWSLKGNRR